jgi:asparagine synthase (glutamine-hydrolysing)
MCGISGLFKTNVSLEMIHPMVQSLNHRGPDAQEYWIDNELGIAFGHARLSIVDIQGGNQPMTDAYGRYTIVFNGEIYGFRDLKVRYNQYPYQNNSDTELIFAMLYEHGYDFVKHLPGMFAFVIYDREKKELFGARDRFGEKPFYYTTNFGGFAFASELKALKKISLEKLNLDLRSVSSYMERLYVPANRCIYQEIKKLDPASCFIYKNGCLELKRYCELPTTTEKIDFEEAVDQLNIKLVDSVKNQLVADVPVGSFLSGGLDSSLITAIAAKISSDKISTYSFGFTQTQSRNELEEARMHAENIGTKHTEFDERDFKLFDVFKTIQSYFDEPFGDSSAIPMYIISNYASKYGKVILTGDGGDELLGGYSQWYHNVLNPPPNSDNRKSGFGLANGKQSIKNLFSYIKGDQKKMGKTSEVENEFLYHHEKNNLLFRHDKITSMGLPLPYGYRYDFTFSRSLGDVFLTDLQNYMVGDILVKTDTTSMANSLELRAPFLDVNLAEFAIGLPSDYKYKGGKNKVILRELIKKHYPFLKRQQDKLGFGAPVEDWLQLKEFDEYRNYVKNDSSALVYQLIDFAKMGDRLDLNNYRTWAVINLNAWLDAKNQLLN